MNRTINQDYQILLKCVRKLYPNYKETSREVPNSWYRVLIADRLIRKGYSLTLIGRVMKKDHSTISFYKNTANYPNCKEFKDIKAEFETESEIALVDTETLDSQYTYILVEIPTEFIKMELARRLERKEQEFLYSVDGLSDSIYAVDKEEADKKIRELNPDAVIMFIRTIERKRL